MSFWSSIKRAFKKFPSDDFWYYPANAPASSGVHVSEQSALKYLTVFSCVSLIAGDLARLPLNLYKRREDGGKDLVTDTDLYDLLHNAPNRETTSFNWREASQGHCLLWGNSYSYVERENISGKIKAIWQITNPGEVKVERAANNELVYVYPDRNGNKVTRTRDQIFHVPGYGYNGLVGMSMISLAREAIGLGLATEEFGGKYFGQGTHPAGVLEMDGTLGGDGKGEFVKAIQKGYAGLGNTHKVMLLENGMKYKPMTVPLNDAQFLETRSFQKTEICGMYHVPPHKIAQHGQNSNYNNLEQENASYVDSCLMHWIVRWESNISMQLLTAEERKAGFFFEFLVQGLLRGDSAARADYYNKIFQVGGITPNEIRSKENMNPVEGGDDNFVMLNMIPLDKAGEMPVEPEPPKEPDQLEEIKSWVRDAENRSSEKHIKSLTALKTSHTRLLLKAAEDVLSKETAAILRAAKKHLTQRTVDGFENFLESFYKDHESYVRNKFDPVLRVYGEAIFKESSRIMSADAVLSPSLEKFMYDYFEKFAFDHCRKGQAELISILEKATDKDALAIVTKRVDEWYEKSPKKIARDQSARMLGAMSRETWSNLGATKLRWTTIGKNCPFCDQLDGTVVGIDREFIKAGSVLYIDTKTGGSSWYDPDTGKYSGDINDDNKEKHNVTAMKFYGTKMHPPIHQGCDCRILPG